MNVTAKHGQAAIHLGGHEINNEGHYASACGINATANTRFTTRGYRNVQKLRPTEKAVTCKRCLKYSAAWDQPYSAQTREEAIEAAQALSR